MLAFLADEESTGEFGSKPAKDNAVAELCHALSRLAAYRWPVRVTPAVRLLLTELSDAFGTPIDQDRLDPGLDYFGMFHGVDERVPVAGLRFGVRVLDRFLRERPGPG
ncbi:MAG: hypothetical protein L0Y54_01830 [Sporichthyaceae bacterium]|nr:hypothetical protein [Sporichthyaceae bacterium]